MSSKRLPAAPKWSSPLKPTVEAHISPRAISHEELSSRATNPKAGKILHNNRAALSHGKQQDLDYVDLLRTCAKKKDLVRGIKLHDDILKRGLLGKSSYVANALVTMYAKCGALERAQECFDGLHVRDIFSWNALISGYAQQGQGQDALDCFERMQHEGLSPNAVTFTCILKACGGIGAVGKGEQIHHEIAKQGLLKKDVLLGNALVDMYAKCGALPKARQVLEVLPVRDVVSWSTLIAGYAQQGQGEEALHCLEQMLWEGLSPNAVTYSCILKACGSIRSVEKGQKIHDDIAKQGLLENNMVLGNALVDMYVKCGALAKAQRVLEELPALNVAAWSAVIAGYAHDGQGQNALDCYERMRRKGLTPNAVTYVGILKACGSIGAADKGERIHNEIGRQGLLEKDIVLGNALVDMYAKCGALGKAKKVLEELPARDVISWSTLIAGYIQCGQGQNALDCFEQMQYEGLSPNAVTFTCILKACGSTGSIDQGEKIHDEIAKRELLEKDIVLGNALVDMYAKCGALAKAQRVLENLPAQNVLSWNALIAGYAQQGQVEEALNYYERMQCKGISPNAATFTCILKACGSIGAVDKGELIHDEIAKQGLLEKDAVLGNTLVDMYAKCGALDKAQQVLEVLPNRDVVSWSTLIAGYTQQGKGENALDCFEKMEREGLSPNAVTFTCILKACGSIGAVDKGEQIHDEIAKQGLLEKDILLGTALADMYCKCGALAKAQEVLEVIPVGDVVLWSALIAGYTQQGQGQDALSCFELMQRKGLPPDAVTLSCVLKACSHSALVDEGQVLFSNMSGKYGVTPDVDHYTCMVDLFGRAGHFDKAVAMIEEMPSSDCPVVWTALLGACQKWGEVNVGRWAFEHAIQLDKGDASAYVCMANIYAAAGMQEAAEKVEAMRARNKAWK